MKFIEMYIPEGRKNRPGRLMTPRWITIHDTGNTRPGAGAANHANYLRGDAAAKGMVSWHLTVDELDVYQSLPFNECGYHAGDGAGPGNRQSIGMELCMHLDGDRKKIEAKGAAAIAQLIRTVPTLLPFPECIVQHNHWSGKNCPQVLRARKGGWEGFLKAIEKELKPSDAITVYAAGKLLPNGRLIDGVTYVPARAVGEALGARVTWEPKKRVVRIERK